MTIFSKSDSDFTDRRRFLTLAAGGLLVMGGAAPPSQRPSPAPPQSQKQDDAEEEKEEAEVSPSEDLMREHGVLNRILLIYDENVRRLEHRGETTAKPDPDAIGGSAKIIRSFIEEYHEKLEEEFLFPRFIKANKFTDLVAILLQQHQAGRQVTDRVLSLATPKILNDSDQARALAVELRRFTRMYRPHEAREDTVLFPAFRTIVSAHEYAALGEEFEKREQERFGADGFEKVVGQVAAIEKELGIYDLAQFTPTLQPVSPVADR